MLQPLPLGLAVRVRAVVGEGHEHLRDGVLDGGAVEPRERRVVIARRAAAHVVERAEILLRGGIVVPRGVEHMPAAAEETEVVLVEPATVLNTGNVVNDRTVAELERI